MPGPRDHMRWRKLASRRRGDVPGRPGSCLAPSAGSQNQPVVLGGDKLKVLRWPHSEERSHCSSGPTIGVARSYQFLLPSIQPVLAVLITLRLSGRFCAASTASERRLLEVAL